MDKWVCKRINGCMVGNKDKKMEWWMMDRWIGIRMRQINEWMNIQMDRPMKLKREREG